MKTKNIKHKILIFIALVFIALPIFITAQEDLAVLCSAILESQDNNSACQGLSSNDCREILEKCVAYYDQQSSELSQDIQATQQQKNTLKSQISGLNKKITSLGYQINQSSLLVRDIGFQIKDTEESIGSTTNKIEQAQEQMAAILRAIYEEDQKPPITILLEGDLSDFFSNIFYLENLNFKISDLLESTTNLKAYLEEQKNKMEGERTDLQKTIQIQELQKNESEQAKKQQENYLQLTETQYQQQLKEKEQVEKAAAEIRNRIFQLVGIPDVEAPTFEEALAVAKYVERITGVRPAFLLAILTQETNLGKNVGQCYLRDPETGVGIGINTGTEYVGVMRPKDVPIFLEITHQLGRDPFATRVSCPLHRPSQGLVAGKNSWGGAMGPAQFIASTWNIYKDRLADILGRPADPWNIQDAFLASGLYLSDFGAAKQTRDEEWCAAQAYFTGRLCNSNHAFYGNSVIRIADQLAKDIEAIGG